MLVLSRKESESIQIGDAVTVKVVLVAGRRVKLAIDAPRDVPVRRGELVRDDARTPSPQCVMSSLTALAAHAES